MGVFSTIGNGYLAGSTTGIFNVPAPPVNGTGSSASLNGNNLSLSDYWKELTSGEVKKDVTASGTNIANAAGSVSDIFLRGVVIITGFIFLAVGLSMFKSGTIVSAAAAPVKAVKKGLL